MVWHRPFHPCSVNQLTIVIGILAAQIINFLIAEKVPEGTTDVEILQSWNGQMGWRWMFWAGTVPAFAFFLLAFLIPESPRFLAKSGKWDGSLKILERIGGREYALQEQKNIAETLNESNTKVDWKALTAKKVRPMLILGIVLAVFQQWCGINVIFNYAEEIFTSAGYSVGDMLFNIVITGTVNLVFTLLAMRMVDSWGRRKLMLLGSIGLAVIYFMLGTSYFFELKGIAILVLVMVAIATYATALWIACFVLTYTFPILNKLLNASGTFWLYGFICLSGFLFILKKLPETKGRSLEEIEKGI